MNTAGVARNPHRDASPEEILAYTRPEVAGGNAGAAQGRDR
jgi:hypothetical protein